MRLIFGFTRLSSRLRAVDCPGPGTVAVGLAASRAGTGILALTASLALVLGLLVYMVDRPPGQAAMMPAVLAFGTGSLFGALGNWLPSFAHPFSFSLFSAALCAPASAPACRACLAWWLVNVAFELGQHAQFREAVVGNLQLILDSGWLTQLVSNYLQRGTFDVGDLIAATLGSLAAAAVLYFKHHREVSNAR